ncbi:hypothetical protein [Epilithonimonas caeni]|uniref:hypothetical protein n=1 Tax=Chryseobacterium group TaxID=2782232 RepID=UPI0003FC4F11|nr:hypothetical protein [Epilithonimonas caeni]
MINKNIWNLYKNSEKGSQTIELFTFNKESSNLEVRAKEIFQRYNEYLGGIDTEENFLDICFLVIDSIIADGLHNNDTENSSEYFTKLIDNIELFFVEENNDGELTKLAGELPIIPKKNYKSFCSILPEISLILSFYSDLFFIPILFREQFDVFMKILDVLDIPLPELPPKSDKRGRLMLYNELNKNIAKFAEKNNLTAEETCACIYDFAFMLLEECHTQNDLPQPTNIWLTGASKEDFKTFLENPIKGEKSVWTCNENTKRGDIIIIYVLSPFSCIQSIWRADIDGVYTPFNYYNSRTKVTDGIKIPQVTLNELKNDPYFSSLPITRKNFQGVNGVKFSAKDYQELQRLLCEKGLDISILPQLYKPNLEFDKQINCEKDVEDKLLIPLLEKIGYSETDWTRQLLQKVGRNEKAIPDFVFMPTGELHFQNTPLVIEAKFDISSNIEQTKTYNQALSYARIMKSSTIGICDKERLIIYKEKNGHFDRFKPTFEEYWQNINNAETFRDLKLLISKEALK